MVRDVDAYNESFHARYTEHGCDGCAGVEVVKDKVKEPGLGRVVVIAVLNGCPIGQ